ncbi:hypothetical protein [Microcoleus sp. Z1_B2]|uniref:hypothetical protein n=1 Tax=Microcoleus sp. Z1_B2 TaxID=3055429 RepID=UPI002FCFDF09
MDNLKNPPRPGYYGLSIGHDLTLTFGSTQNTEHPLVSGESPSGATMILELK